MNFFVPFNASPLFSLRNNNALFPTFDDHRANVRGAPDHVKREMHTHVRGNLLRWKEERDLLQTSLFRGGYSPSLPSAIRRTSRGRERIGRAARGTPPPLAARRSGRARASSVGSTARGGAAPGRERASDRLEEEWRVGLGGGGSIGLLAASLLPSTTIHPCRRRRRDGAVAQNAHVVRFSHPPPPPPMSVRPSVCRERLLRSRIWL